MSYDTILLEISDAVATLTLNRPDRLNACSPTMAGEMAHALTRLGDARALVITGAGRAFCSGADLQAKDGDSGSIAGGDASYAALMGHYNPLILALARLPLPIVTAINGAAAGIGCSIALAGDFVLAGQSAYFLQAFVNIGLVPDGGASWMLPRLIGKARATEMMMLGERIGADKAADWGMIYASVADDALQADARALALRLAAGPTTAHAIMRRNILTALENSLAEQLLAEAEGQRRASGSADATEGVMAFLAKRKPAFTGN